MIGLDEKVNTGKTENSLETARNIGAKIGSYLGIQRSEWEGFTESFLNVAVEKVTAKRKGNSA